VITFPENAVIYLERIAGVYLGFGAQGNKRHEKTKSCAFSNGHGSKSKGGGIKYRKANRKHKSPLANNSAIVTETHRLLMNTVFLIHLKTEVCSYNDRLFTIN
jgi:hypothetical protein